MPRHPTSEQTARTRHIFARVMDGQSTADIAAAEGVTVRRIQQIVADELKRTQSNPANDLKLLQIARLEVAFALLGDEIDAGKAAAVPTFVKVAEQLRQLTGDQLWLCSPGLRETGDVAAVHDRLERLEATREIVAERRQKRAQAGEAKGNAG